MVKGLGNNVYLKHQYFFSHHNYLFDRYNFQVVKNTVISVYKDTLYKDNLGKIWPKPTLRTIWENFAKDNLGKSHLSL
jgi:hypothetical protein